ncbi:MAG: hypothetical protein FWF80_08680 [Defluviitaleaceae bacterium]|nr:hypothetical protein [Defluviitaleaceae bacterium]
MPGQREIIEDRFLSQTSVLDNNLFNVLGNITATHFPGQFTDLDVIWELRDPLGYIMDSGDVAVTDTD